MAAQAGQVDRGGRPTAAFMLLAGALSVWGVWSGCGSVPRGGQAVLEVDGRAAPTAEAVIEALRPVTLVVHPLTRVEYDERGMARLVVQIELRDRMGDAVKWLGVARVEVTPVGRVEPGAAAAVEVVENLSTGELSAARFDWMSRMYVLKAGGTLPAWLGGGDGQGRQAGGAGVGARVRAWFTYRGADGEPVTLSGELLLEAARGAGPRGAGRSLPAGASGVVGDGP